MSKEPAKTPICPTCKGPVEDRTNAPFCSERCKMSDLARWLHGEYAIPSYAEPGFEDWPEDLEN